MTYSEWLLYQLYDFGIGLGIIVVIAILALVYSRFKKAK